MNCTHSPSIPPRGARGTTVRAGACLLALASAARVARAQEGQGVPPSTAPPKSITVEPTPVQDETTPEERRTQRLTRPRRVRAGEPRTRVGGGIGYGHFEINASELGRRDSEDAFVMRFDFETWPSPYVGFGLYSELISTEDDLFEGQTIESGVGQRSGEADFGAHDMTMFFGWNPFGASRFRLPLRIGPWFNGFGLDYDRAGIDYYFATAGARISATPEVRVADSEKVDVVLFAGASYSIGYTSIYEDLIGFDEVFESEAQQFRAEGGVRVDLRGLTLGLHYVYSDMGVNLSDVEFGRRLPEVDWDVNMFFVTVGGRF